MSIEETLGFFRLPQGDSEIASGEIQSALPSSGRLATLRTTGRLKADGSWDPSVLHRKKLRRNKRTSDIFRWWLFSMDLLREETVERHFDGMEADWSFGHLDVLALVYVFCDESWPSSFWLGSIPDQQLTLLISKDECVMKGMRPFRKQIWNRILRTLFGILDVSTLLFVDKCHLNLCELGDVDGGDKATGRQGRKSTKVCGFFWMILQGFFLEVSSFSMIWETLHMFHPCFFLMEVLWFHGDVSPTCQPV